MKKTTDLKTTIEVRSEKGLWADLRIINEGDRSILVHNPGNYRPTEGWEFSHEAYQVAALQSFHFLEMKLTIAGGMLVNPHQIATRANHVVGLPLELKPGAELKIPIPLHEFYDLKSGTTYSLELTYGDKDLKVSAQSQFQSP
jgi:hypothetical protein